MQINLYSITNIAIFGLHVLNILCFQKILRPVDGNVPEVTNVVHNVQLNSIPSANEDYSSVSSESVSAIATPVSLMIVTMMLWGSVLRIQPACEYDNSGFLWALLAFPIFLQTFELL